MHLPARQTPEPATSKVASGLAGTDDWRLPQTPDIHGIAFDHYTIEVATGGALIPDHAVFLEKKVPVCASPDDIATTISQYRSKYGDEPDWMIVRDAGVVLSRRIGAAGEAQLRGLAMISLRIPPGSTIGYIDEKAAAELQTWDAEIYRKKLDEDRPRQS